MKCNRIDALRIFGKKSWLIFFIIISAVQQQKHIMISYQWDVQPQVLKIRERLKQAGYNVWIDVEQMRKGKQWDEIYHLIETGRLPKYQVCSIWESSYQWCRDTIACKSVIIHYQWNEYLLYFNACGIYVKNLLISRFLH